MTVSLMKQDIGGNMKISKWAAIAFAAEELVTVGLSYIAWESCGNVGILDTITCLIGG